MLNGLLKLKFIEIDNLLAFRYAVLNQNKLSQNVFQIKVPQFWDTSEESKFKYSKFYIPNKFYATFGYTKDPSLHLQRLLSCKSWSPLRGDLGDGLGLS